MFMRPARIRHSGRWIPVAALAAFGIAIGRPHSLSAQQATGAMPATHTVKRGDTLWDIAKLYLGDPFLWPEIYRLNTDIIEDPHWIYPGEQLKLPAPAKVVAVTPPPASQPQRPAPAMPTILDPAPPPPRDTTPPVEIPRSTVRMNEYIASPWVDQRGGPGGSGYIMQAADLPGIASADHSRMHLYDKLVFTPPVGSVAPERELFLAYRLGPLIEGFGQIVIPTGVVEVTRSARDGEAGVGRVVKMFGEVLQDQRLIPLDTNAALGRGRPAAVTNGRMGKVRWVLNSPILPTMQNAVVVDIARTDVSTGDQVELYQPRKKSLDGQTLAIPETHIASGQVLRVTPYGATVLLTTQEQPKIGEGTAARVAAKIP